MGAESAMSLVSSSVNLIAPLATYTQKAEFKKNATIDDAIALGNLDDQASIVTISDEGQVAASSVTSTFNVTTGGVTSLTKTFDNVVTQVSTTFQLLDNAGTVVASNATDATDAQKLAYAEWEDGRLVLEAGTYTAAATAGNGASLSISAMEQQGTSLEVHSELTGSDQTEYYTFSLSGSDIKFDLTSEDKSSMRVILYNSSGAVVADSDGNARQKANYLSLISTTGLAANSGDFTLEITYKDNANIEKSIDYTARLYTGDYYSVVYKSTVTAQAYDNSAIGSMTPDESVEQFSSKKYNKIYTAPDQAVNIGWMKQDESMLDVYSMLTAADNIDYYRFTFQEGEAIKFDFSKSTDASGIRVQLLDRSGQRVIADSHGTDSQKEVYEQLTSASGLEADTGQYVIKVSYVDGVERSDMSYEFGLYSGSTYVAKYKTTASAQTFANAILAGEMSVSSTQATLASVLSATDDDSALLNTLKSLV